MHCEIPMVFNNPDTRPIFRKKESGIEDGIILDSVYTPTEDTQQVGLFSIQSSSSIQSPTGSIQSPTGSVFIGENFMSCGDAVDDTISSAELRAGHPVFEDDADAATKQTHKAKARNTASSCVQLRNGDYKL